MKTPPADVKWSKMTLPMTRAAAFIVTKVTTSWSSWQSKTTATQQTMKRRNFKPCKSFIGTCRKHTPTPTAANPFNTEFANAKVRAINKQVYSLSWPRDSLKLGQLFDDQDPGSGIRTASYDPTPRQIPTDQPTPTPPHTLPYPSMSRQEWLSGYPTLPRPFYVICFMQITHTTNAKIHCIPKY